MGGADEARPVHVTPREVIQSLLMTRAGIFDDGMADRLSWLAGGDLTAVVNYVRRAALVGRERTP
jgi:hypothetical protein